MAGEKLDAKEQKSSLKAEKKAEKERLKEEKRKDKEKRLKKAEKDKKEKKGLFKRLREAWGELKKTTWPTFSQVVKKTGIVLLVVLIFTVVLFLIDYGLGALYNVLMS